MSEETTVNNTHDVHDPCHVFPCTNTQHIVQNSKVTVSPSELDRNIERICKAFIRLITAPESEEDLAEIPTSSERSTTRV